MTCSNCGKEFEGKFCNNCGNPAPIKTICQKCGFEYEGKFCSNCGSEYVQPIDERCRNLQANNGFEIDVEKLAGLYLSVAELKMFFKKFTPYSEHEIKEFSQYIYDNIDGNDFNPLQLFTEKLKFEAMYTPEPFRESAPSHSQWRHAVSYKQEPQCRPEPAQRVVAEREKPHKMSRRELKIQAHNSGQACCPKCGSTSLSANKKGFGVGKALLGASATMFTPLGPLGAVAGNINAKKVWVTCLNCGKRWKM